MNLIGRFSLKVPRVSRRKPRESSRGSKPCPAHAPPTCLNGKMCQWRGRWGGRCAREGEDVPMKGKMWPWRCGNSRFQKVENKSVRESISRKQTSRVSARRHPSTKNDPRVSLRTGWPPVDTWRIIPFSKWLITLVSKSPKQGCSPYKWPKWLLNGGY